MSDLLLVLSGVMVVCGIALIVTAVDRIGKCRHDWGQWMFKEDSAVFIQVRHCEKCGYSEIEQFRKMKEPK